MKFLISKNKESPINLLRRVGYKYLSTTPDAELVFSRSIVGGDFPRFHIYAREQGDKLEISLHLDQKKPSYEGSSAHGGEYDGELVAEEVNNIKKLVETK